MSESKENAEYQATLRRYEREAAEKRSGSAASPCSDSWEAINAEHARITFWRDAWTKANDNRKPPYLQTTQEYIERRWDRANRRMKRLMDRADRFRASHPNNQDQRPR